MQRCQAALQSRPKRACQQIGLVAESVLDLVGLGIRRLGGHRCPGSRELTPDAFDLISTLARRYAGDEVTLAAGTVRTSNDAAQARRAGAEIIVSPHTDVRVIEYAIENDMLTIAGAATATEILHAWEAGCDIVKIFPAPQLGGPDYIRAIRGPIRDVPMLAGGPVSLDAIEGYLDAGCVAVNLGIALAVPDLVRQKQWEEIGRRVILATSIVQSRKSMTPAESVYVH